jgi:pseudouridine synthase
MTIRLAKLLAQRGVASRRKAEEMIDAGRVSVNGVTADKVTPVDPSAHIRVDGRPLPAETAKAYYLLNKPRGYITGREDTRGRRSVLELARELPVRVEPVGRLDYDTEGALLLTNDGTLAHAVTHPSRGVPKKYLALVEGRPGRAMLGVLRSGVPLEDGTTAPAHVRTVSSDGERTLLEVTVTEGRNRLIKRMMKQVGHPVLELRRTEFGNLTVKGLGKGKLRPLTDEEVAALRALTGKG